MTTKKGSEGRAQVSYDFYKGRQNIAKLPQTLNAQEYMAIMDEARINDGLMSYDWSTQMPASTWEMIQNGWEGADWLDEIVGKNAPQMNHSLGVTGGNDMGNYSISLNYTSQEGVIGRNHFTSKYERYSCHINSKWTLIRGKKNKLDILKFGENVRLNFSKQSGLSGVKSGGPYWNDIRWAMEAFPIMTVYDEGGNFSSAMNEWSILRRNPVARMCHLASAPDSSVF